MSKKKTFSDEKKKEVPGFSDKTKVAPLKERALKKFNSDKENANSGARVVPNGQDIVSDQEIGNDQFDLSDWLRMLWDVIFPQSGDLSDNEGIWYFEIQHTSEDWWQREKVEVPLASSARSFRRKNKNFLKISEGINKSEGTGSPSPFRLSPITKSSQKKKWKGAGGKVMVANAMASPHPKKTINDTNISSPTPYSHILGRLDMDSANGTCPSTSGTVDRTLPSRERSVTFEKDHDTAARLVSASAHLGSSEGAEGDGNASMSDIVVDMFGTEAAGVVDSEGGNIIKASVVVNEPDPLGETVFSDMIRRNLNEEKVSAKVSASSPSTLASNIVPSTTTTTTTSNITAITATSATSMVLPPTTAKYTAESVGYKSNIAVDMERPMPTVAALTGYSEPKAFWDSVERI